MANSEEPGSYPESD